MNTLTLYPIIDALAAGLLHSLWLFPLLVGVDWLVSRRLSRSAHRYLAHLLTLLSCALVFFGIVGHRWWSLTAAFGEAVFLEGELGGELTLQLTDGFAKLGLTPEGGWAEYLVGVYVVGLLFLLGRWGYRYWLTVRLRRGGLLPEPAHRELFRALSREVLPGGRVDWRITDRVRSVLVVGILRPVVLFPVGLINQLSVEEVSAILRHELTHLRRHDPLWNAIQELLQALFFYHPVIYWLGRELDREREFACDDAVLEQTEPKIYARALLRAASYSLHPKIPLTMAATSAPNFTQRIQRLFATDEANHLRTPLLTFRFSLLPPLAMLPLLLLLAYTVVSPYQLTAQVTGSASVSKEIVLTGTIIAGDTKQPLIGATVVVPNAKLGTITDFDGKYELTVNSDQLNVALSYVGYEPVYVQLMTDRDAAEVNFVMYPDQKSVISSKDDGVEAIYLKKVKDEDMKGLRKAQRSKVRGAAVNDSGKITDNALFVVDGKKVEFGKDGLNELDPATIEKIEVIKDEDKIRALGHGTDYSGAVIITLKKQ